LRILITGSKGLIGRHLTAALQDRGVQVQGLDLRANGADRGDVRAPSEVASALQGCSGVVHLAAVSRVIDGEKHPETCWDTNVVGTHNVLEAAAASSREPWVVYASSREVYGQPDTLPVHEDAPLRPVNLYGRSKVAAEDACRASALRTSIVRFSNVYGCAEDHQDRVVPAFARQAARGERLRVDGRHHTFDFTHVDDTVAGLVALIERLETGADLPPIHFVTGTPTTLGALAELAIALTTSGSSWYEAPARDFDVARFVGDPSRARRLLDWQPTTDLPTGLGRLIQDFTVER